MERKFEGWTKERGTDTQKTKLDRTSLSILVLLIINSLQPLCRYKFEARAFGLQLLRKLSTRACVLAPLSLFFLKV